jgi:hypothetical protein
VPLTFKNAATIIRPMTPQSFIQYFGGTQTAAGSAIGVRQSVVSDWVRADRIPYVRQLQIQELSRRKLRADKDGWREELPKRD